MIRLQKMLGHMWVFLDCSRDGTYGNWTNKLGAVGVAVSDEKKGSVPALPL